MRGLLGIITITVLASLPVEGNTFQDAFNNLITFFEKSFVEKPVSTTNIGLDATESHGVLWGIADTDASIGHLFKYKIAHNALKGNINDYKLEAKSAGDSPLPPWLYFNKTSCSFYGLPTPTDEGVAYIEIVATPHSSPEEMYTVSFLIKIQMPRKVKLGGKIYKASQGEEVSAKVFTCPFDESTNHASLVFDATISDIDAPERVHLLYKAAIFLGQSVLGISLMPKRNSVVAKLLDQQVLVAGPGDAKFGTKNTGVELMWVVGCGEFKQADDVSTVMEHNIKNGLIYRELGFRVMGWHVSQTLPPEHVRKRMKRQVMGTPTPTVSSSPPTRLSDMSTVTETMVTTTSASSLVATTQYPESTSSAPKNTLSVRPSMTASLSVAPTESAIASRSQNGSSAATPVPLTSLPGNTDGSISQTTTISTIQPSVLPTESFSIFESMSDIYTTSSSALSSPTDSSIEPSMTVVPSSSRLEYSETPEITNYTASMSLSSSMSIDSSIPVIDTTIIKSASSSMEISPSSSSSFAVTESPSPTMALNSSSVLTTSPASSSVYSSFEIYSSSLLTASAEVPFTTSYSIIVQPSSTLAEQNSTVSSTPVPEVSSILSQSPSLAISSLETYTPISNSTSLFSSLLVSSSSLIEPVTSHTSSSFFSTSLGVSSDSTLTTIFPTTLVSSELVSSTVNMPTTSEVFTSPSVTTLLPSETEFISTEFSTFAPTPSLPTSSLNYTTSKPTPTSSILDSSILGTDSTSPQVTMSSLLLTSKSSALRVLTTSKEISVSTSAYTSPDVSVYPSSPRSESSSAVFTSTTLPEYSSGQIIGIETFSHAPVPETSSYIPTSSEVISSSSAQTSSSDFPPQPSESSYVATSVFLSSSTVIKSNVTSVQSTPSSDLPSSTISSSLYISSSSAVVTTTVVTTESSVTSKATTDSMTVTSKPLTTEPVSTPEQTTETITTVKPNTAPVHARQIEKISSRLGTYFSFTVPEDTFIDEEDGNTRNLNLTLFLGDGSSLVPTSWVQFDKTAQRIYGLPLSKDLTDLPGEFVLVAEDSGGLKARDAFQIPVDHTEVQGISFEFILQFTQDFLAFMLATNNYIDVARKLDAYYGDTNSSLVTITDISSGSVIMSVTNNSISQDVCENETILELYRRMNSSEQLNLDFVRAMVPWAVSQTDLQWRGVCIIEPANATEAPTAGPVIAAGGTNISVIIAVILVILIIIAIIILLCCIWRRRKAQKGRYLPEDEKPIFGNNRKPVLLEHELELRDKSTRSKRPMILPNDMDPYSYSNEGYTPAEDNQDRAVPPPYVLPRDGGYAPNFDIPDSPASPPEYLPSPTAASSPLDLPPPPEYKLPPPYMIYPGHSDA